MADFNRNPDGGTMRICVFNEHEEGTGAAIAARRLAVALARTGHEVLFLYQYPRAVPPVPGCRTERLEAGVPRWIRGMHRVTFRLHEKLARRHSTAPAGVVADASCRVLLRNCYRTTGRRLMKRLERFRPDVVSLHNLSVSIGHDEVTQIASRWPVVWTLHDCSPMRLYAYRYTLPNGRERFDPPVWMTTDGGAVERLLESRARIVFVSPSQWLADDAMEVVRGRKPVLTIPNGFSPTELFPESPPEARKALKWEGGARLRVLAVAVSLLSKRKNLGVVLDAARRASAAGIDLALLGNAPAQLPADYAHARCFPPARDPASLRRALSAADVLVVPSLIDNLPNIVIESFFCGTPVAGARTGGIPEMVVPGTSGWLFEPCDAAGLAALLERLAANPEAATGLRAGLVPWARARYNDGLMADNYLDVFRRLEAGGSGDEIPMRPPVGD